VHIGGSHSQVLSIRAEREAGVSVILVDRSPDAPARSECDYFIQADARQTSRIVNRLRASTRGYQIVGAYGVADYAFQSVGAIHSEFCPWLPNFKTYRKFTNKHLTNQLLQKSGVPQPQQLWSGKRSDWPKNTEILKQANGKGIVVKPACQNNSRGVVILDKPREESLRAAVRRAFVGGEFVCIEVKEQGTICNFCGFMAAGRLFPVSTTFRIDDRETPQLCVAMIQPAELWPGFFQAARDLAKKAIKALDYQEGPFTMDMISVGTAPKALKVLEISPHYHLPQCDWIRGNGNPLAACVLRYAKNPAWRENFARKGRAAACVQVMGRHHRKGRIVATLNHLSRSKLFRHFSLIKNNGRNLKPLSRQKALIALVWLAGPSVRKVLRMVKKLQKITESLSV